MHHPRSFGAGFAGRVSRKSSLRWFRSRPFAALAASGNALSGCVRFREVLPVIKNPGSGVCCFIDIPAAAVSGVDAAGGQGFAFTLADAFAR